MQYDYKSLKTNQPRTVYLDLNHKLTTPWEVNPAAQGVDEIYCKRARLLAWRIDDRYSDYVDGDSAYCSQCLATFDPETVCPRITVAGEEKGIRIVTLVR